MHDFFFRLFIKNSTFEKKIIDKLGQSEENIETSLNHTFREINNFKFNFFKNRILNY